MLFSDYILDLELKQTLGMAMCFTALFNVVVNMGIMLTLSVKDAIFKIRKKCNNRKYMRQLKQSTLRFKRVKRISERAIAWKVEQAIGQRNTKPGMGNG